jgi:hypothetical protein
MKISIKILGLGTHLKVHSGVYILENTRPPPGGEKKYQPMSFGGKNIKRRREKGENIKEKGRKGKKKEERGKKMRKGEVKG